VTSTAKLTICLTAMLLAAAVEGAASHAQTAANPAHPTPHQRARVAFSHALPKLDGNHLQATLVEVHYGPGEASPPHSHPCAVIGYIVEGTLRTQVKGEPEAIYKTGESFYEAPGGVHAVSANASQTEPADFIAYFVCDHDQPLSTDAPVTTHSGAK
jgi:quercetin dioxygenase-like cupin family protein